MTNKFKIGDAVIKKTGYQFPGIVVSAFETFSHGHIRYVIESTSSDTAGMLHIFNESQLEPAVQLKAIYDAIVLRQARDARAQLKV